MLVGSFPRALFYQSYGKYVEWPYILLFNSNIFENVRSAISDYMMKEA